MLVRLFIQRCHHGGKQQRTFGKQIQIGGSRTGWKRGTFEDLRLRGAGELLGTRQSGLPKFKVADLQTHGRLLQIARDDARLVIEKDPELLTERGNALRTLLYLFERDNAIRYLSSG